MAKKQSSKQPSIFRNGVLVISRDEETTIFPLHRVSLMIAKFDKNGESVEAIRIFVGGEDFYVQKQSGKSPSAPNVISVDEHSDSSLLSIMNAYKNVYYVVTFPQTPDESLPLILFQSLFLEKCVIRFPKIELFILCGSGETLKYTITIKDKHSFDVVVGELYKELEKVSIYQRR